MRKLLSFFLTVVALFIFQANSILASELPVVKSGVQDQLLPDITITTTAGPTDFQSGASNRIALRFPDGIEPTEVGKVVTSGDMMIDPSGAKITQGLDGFADTDHYYVWCRVLSPGTTPSSVTFQGIKVTLDRTVAQGDLKIELTGDYLNSTAEQFLGDNDPTVTVATITSSTAKANNTATFMIDQSKYWVNGEQKTLDAAPYIDSNGRTLVPLRAFAESMGALVSWDDNTQTASLLKNGSAVSVQVDSGYLNVNGVMIKLDSAAINKDGRIFLPFRPIAEALGAHVTWDAANQALHVN